MRIRKNRKLSHGIGLESTDEKQLQPHFCQLNQSPWDAIPFSQESTHQLETQNTFGENGTSQNSIRAADRVEKEEGLEERKRLNEVDEEKEVIKDKQINSKCDDDLLYPKSSLKRSNKYDSRICVLALMSPTIKKTDQRVAGGTCRGAKKRARKKEKDLNPNQQEFYYYSGFGPLWGKKKR